jgi:hypothetical protein
MHKISRTRVVSCVVSWYNYYYNLPPPLAVLVTAAPARLASVEKFPTRLAAQAKNRLTEPRQQHEPVVDKLKPPNIRVPHLLDVHYNDDVYSL